MSVLAPSRPAPGADATHAPAAVRAIDLERRYRNGRGVGPVSLDVRQGECLGLMGPNGAGKTTLLRMLATLDRQYAGTLRWGGAESLRDARRQIGFAPDIVVEEGALTARQATHFWCRQWRSAAESRERVRGALAMFDLLSVADEPVSRFSFGMRRRLGLAQALVHAPSLALFDEPTAGLDPAGVAALQAALARRHGGETAVIASNDCDFVAAVCDRVLFIDAGVVVADGAPAALVASLGGARRADLSVSGTCDLIGLRRLAGVGSVELTGEVVRVELRDDAALPRVVAAVDRPVGALRAVQVKSPDLSDAFWHMTGRALAGETEPD